MPRFSCDSKHLAEGAAAAAGDSQAGEDAPDDAESHSSPPKGPARASMKRPAASPADYFFGLDEEHMRPWRANSSDTRRREWGELVVDPDGQPDGPALAQFADAPPVALGQVTNEEAATMLSSRLHRRGSFWTGSLADGTTLKVARRPDRDPLVAIFEKKPSDKERQILMVRVRTFGEGDSALDAAVSLMTSIAEEYRNGTVEAAKLYHLRDQKMTELGLKGGRSARKRPSAAPTAAPASSEAPAAAAAAAVPKVSPAAPAPKRRRRGKSAGAPAAEAAAPAAESPEQPAPATPAAKGRRPVGAIASGEVDDRGWDLF